MSKQTIITMFKYVQEELNKISAREKLTLTESEKEELDDRHVALLNLEGSLYGVQELEEVINTLF